MKKKMYVLDTNVLLDAPDSILSFKENDVIIPFPVIQELDKHKTDEKERERLSDIRSGTEYAVVRAAACKREPS